MLIISAMFILWKSWLGDCSQVKKEWEGHSLCEITGLSGLPAVTPHISVSLGSVTASWDAMAVPNWSWDSEMVVITQGTMHLHSWKVILCYVSFAAFVFLTLMLSETQWLGNNTIHIPTKSTLDLLLLQCSSPYLVQTYARRNAQNWSPW